jgi:twitching motility protein PilU
MVLRRIETRFPRSMTWLPPIIKDLAMTKRGIIIFVGATGTGKSTSLAAMIGTATPTHAATSSPSKTRSKFVHQHNGLHRHPARGRHRHRLL